MAYHTTADQLSNNSPYASSQRSSARSLRIRGATAICSSFSSSTASASSGSAFGQLAPNAIPDAVATSTPSEAHRPAVHNGRRSSSRSRVAGAGVPLRPGTLVGKISSRHMQEALPPYVLVVRIGSILGMSLALAIGLLLLLGGFILPAVVAFLAFLPSFGIMVYAERRAARQEARQP